MNTAVTVASPASAAPVGPHAISDDHDSNPLLLRHVGKLTARLFRVAERWRAHRVLDQAWSSKIDELFFAATGYTSEQWKNLDLEDDLRRKLNSVRGQIIRDNPDDDPTDGDGNSIAVKEIDGELYPVAEEILAAKPHSLADLALQAQAFALTNYDCWEDQNHAYAGIRSLVENICAFVGQPLWTSPDVSAPMARAADGDRRLTEVAAEIQALAAQFEVVGDRHTAAEEAMIEWGRCNPKPGAEKGKKALAQFARARAAAIKKCRFAEAEKEWNGLNSRIDALTREASRIPATTAAGLKCKASIHDVGDDLGENAREALAHSIVEDVRGLLQSAA